MTRADEPGDASRARTVPRADRHVLKALRELFERENYTTAGLRGYWGVEIDQALERNNAAPARWFVARRLSAAVPGAAQSGGADTDGASPADKPQLLAVLAQLFTLAGGVARTQAVAVFGDDLCSRLTAIGLLAEDADGTVSSVLSIRPYAIPIGVPRYGELGEPLGETLYLASDHGTLTNAGAVDGDFVLGVGGAGKTLVEITPRDQRNLGADIGCGCGIQALLLARHTARVIATDVSRRALDVTEFNAGLNGVDNIETRLGSLFDPLDEPVDVLVSNPPFVITPQGHTTTLEYRDGGKPGDELIREVLSGAPAHLAELGQAVFLGNWEYRDGEAGMSGEAATVSGGDDTGTPALGAEPVPLSWIDTPGMDVMVIERERLDPVSYAETWIRDGGVVRAGARWNTDTAAWLDDFAARGVKEIGFGWVRMEKGDDLRAADDPELRHFERITGPLGANNAGLAAHLDTRMGVLQFLLLLTDEQLADRRFVRATDVTEHRHFTPGADQPTVITLEQGTGFARTFDADPALAGFVGVADGELTLAQTAVALAQLLDVDAIALQAQLVDQVRVLVPAGIVYPVSELNTRLTGD